MQIILTVRDPFHGVTQAHIRSSVLAQVEGWSGAADFRCDYILYRGSSRCEPAAVDDLDVTPLTGSRRPGNQGVVSKLEDAEGIDSTARRPSFALVALLLSLLFSIISYENLAQRLARRAPGIRDSARCGVVKQFDRRVTPARTCRGRCARPGRDCLVVGPSCAVVIPAAG